MCEWAGLKLGGMDQLGPGRIDEWAEPMFPVRPNLEPPLFPLAVRIPFFNFLSEFHHLRYALAQPLLLLLDFRMLVDNPELNHLAGAIEIVHRGCLLVYIGSDIEGVFSTHPSIVWVAYHPRIETNCFSSVIPCPRKNRSTRKIHPSGFQPSKMGVCKRRVSASILLLSNFIMMSVSLIFGG